MMIDKDLKQIWSEIYKPEQYADSKPEDFFSFEFAMMPHKIFEPDAFETKARELRSRFDLTANDTLFLASSEANQQVVPIDGMPMFVE